MTPVGTHSPEYQSWLWAWANEDFPPVARDAARRLQALHTMTGFRVFLDPGIAASAADAEDFAGWPFIARGDGFFRSPSDGPTLYLLFISRETKAANKRLPDRPCEHGISSHYIKPA